MRSLSNKQIGEVDCFKCSHKRMCVYFLDVRKLATKMHLSGAKYIKMVFRLAAVVSTECGEYDQEQE